MKTESEIYFIDAATQKLAGARAMSQMIDSDDFANMSQASRYAYAQVLIECINWTDDAIQDEHWRAAKYANSIGKRISR